MEATAKLEKLDFAAYLIAVSRLISRANKYIDETEPWKLAKNEEQKDRLATVMYNLIETIRIALILTAPAMPTLIARANQQLGIFADEKAINWEEAGSFGLSAAGTKVNKGESLFPRIDLKTLEDIEMEDKNVSSQAVAEDKVVVEDKAAVPAEPIAEPAAEKTYITIDEFARMDLRIAEVIACEKMPKADKLLILKVKLGEEERTVVSGIAQHYSPAELVGKKVVVVANLKPTKLRGVVSEGMILAASNEDHSQLEVLMLQSDIPSGNKVR